MAVTNKSCNEMCNLKFTKLPIVVSDSKVLETRVYTLELEWRVGKTVVSEHVKVDMVYTPQPETHNNLQNTIGFKEEYLLDEAETSLAEPILKDYYVILENRLKDRVKFYLKNEIPTLVNYDTSRWEFDKVRGFLTWCGKSYKRKSIK